MTKNTGFGEAIGQNENSLRTQAMLSARNAILKKLGVNFARFGAVIIDEAMFQLPNGNKHYMVVIELTERQE